MGADEGFLRGLVGVGVVPQGAREEPAHRLTMPLEDHVEGLRIPEQRTAAQLGVGDRRLGWPGK
jgi:hypothetical protein